MESAIDQPDQDLDSAALSSRQAAVMMFSVLVVALCGIAYELIIASVSTYLLGNSVTQFSLTIGLFMFAMGLGSFLSKYFRRHLVSTFVFVEISVAIIGGFSSTLLFTVFPMYSLYNPTMYSLIIMIGTLVGLEIPLLTQILSRSSSWKDSVAHVLSLDYFGALIGSVAFPLVLLPSLGLFRSSFAIGLTNAVVAWLTIFVFGRNLPGRRFCLTFASMAIVVLLGGLVMSARITQFAEGQLFADHIIYSRYTPYQRIVMTEGDGSGELRLYLDKHLQFASRDEHRYHESLVHPLMSLPGPRRHVLILGGGDGLVVREVAKYADVESIDLVDIDPAITDLARSFAPLRRINADSLHDPRLRVINQDAFRFIRDQVPAHLAASGDTAEQPSTLYDRVIIDLPDPHNEVLDKLYSREFYEMLSLCMSAEGSLAVQSSSPIYTRRVYWCIGNTLEAAGLHLTSYHIPLNSFGTWGFHLAAKPPLGKADVQIEADKFRYITDDVFAAACVFPPDIARVETPVNRTFEPRLYMLYVADAKQ